ncbi:DNA topoisomerase family protein, partial [Chlamydia suis MD56]|uniref:SWIB/MDM2 domain-containing protein n=1 Tax=Chlamydia suis TaxID=83559 RepID=UPI0003BFFA07
VSSKEAKTKKAVSSKKGTTTKAKKKDPTAKTTRKAPAYTPSAALAAVIGSDPVSHPEATKKLWAYIKDRGLQSSSNKRIILPDDKLKLVLGSEPIDMFALAKKLSANLIKGE